MAQRANGTWDYDPEYWTQKGTGHLWFDPLRGTKWYEPNWVLLLVDQQIINYYAWFAEKKGIKINTKGLWGPHISVIKGELPTRNKTIWGEAFYRPLEFYYSVEIKTDELEIAGRRNKSAHAWLDVWSEDLAKIREVFGVGPRNTFHLTLGLIRN